MSRNTPSEPRASAGFSLVEVVAALAISALALTGLFQGLGNSQRAAAYLEAHLGARLVAQSILSDALMSPETELQPLSGESGPYTWTLTVAPAGLGEAIDLPSPYRIHRLSIEVTWAPRGFFSADALKVGS